MVGLEKQAHKLPAAVSTGQQQSAAIARALATEPPVIAADEPTGNLDSRSAEVIIDLFDSLIKNGKTIIMVTHDPSLTERTTRTVIISDGEIINETVANCFVHLTHHQLLDITLQVETLSYPPGTTILKQGQDIDHFFMIVSGEVEINLVSDSGKTTPITRLGPNQYFGEVELLSGGQTIASVRASQSGPVELVAINRHVFVDLVKESPLTEDTLSRIVHQRLAENRSVRGPG
jgi:energy-coupling factor transporter ATP-binding protein EcfA2